VDETDAAWPPLPLEAWEPTKQTLHRYCQMLGKVRLALAPYRNHWWHVTLRVGTRGLETGPLPLPDGRRVELTLDLVDHAVIGRDSTGASGRFPLRHPFACADFHEQLFTLLRDLGVEVDIDTTPYDLEGPAFTDDRIHDSYDAGAVERYWTVLRHSADVLETFAGRFNGKQSPVHLFWHSFDLAMARFSGRRAPTKPGASQVEADAYSHEVIAFGFWPGDANVRFPAYYSYTAPAPDGLTSQPLRPDAAAWDTTAGTAQLPYDIVRTADDPRATLLAFLESAYRAGATTAGWDLDDLATRVAPPR